MSSFTRSKCIVFAATVVLVAGCSDVTRTVAPRPKDRNADVAQSGGNRPTLIPNSVKYSDKGLHPATGRSGSAQLTARGLLGKDTYTDLEITTGTLDAGAVPPGNLSKLQVKPAWSAETPHSAVNYSDLTAGGYAHYRYSTYARGDSIQVQANVDGIDANRTDVITVTERVKLRPDLTVSTITMPTTVPTGFTIPIRATVRELNGDVGAHADCTLQVNGHAVDQAQAIWVDAYGTVGCLFAYAFPQAGTYTVSVAAQNVAPGDWDVSNNTMSEQIVAVAPTALHGSATASSTNWNYTTYYSWNWGYETGYSWSGQSGPQESVALVASTTDPSAGAVSQLEAQEVLDGTATTTLNAAMNGWDNDDGTQSCATAYDGTQNAWLTACRNDDGSAVAVNYSRSAQAVTYYSGLYTCLYFYQHTGCGGGPNPTYSTYSGQVLGVASASNVQVNVLAGIGTQWFAATPTMGISVNSYTYDYYWCQWWGTDNSCQQSVGSPVFASGSATF